MRRITLLLALFWATATLCCGCAGTSTSSSTTPVAVTETAATSTTGGTTLAGTVATGLALDAATVTVKDRSGHIVGRGTTDGHGRYAIQLAADAASPCLVQAASPRAILYGVGEPPRVNVTPYTQLVLEQYYAAHGTTVTKAFASLDRATPIPHHRAVSGIVASLTTEAFRAYGVPRRFSPIRSAFTARAAGESKGDPFDQVLDHSTFTATTVAIDLGSGRTQRITLRGDKTADGVAFTRSMKTSKTASATTQTLSTTQLVPTTTTSGATLNGTLSGGPTDVGQASMQALPIPVDGALNPSATLFSSPVAADADGTFSLPFSTTPSGPVLLFASWLDGSVLSASGEPATSAATEATTLAGAVIPSGMLQACVLSVADAPDRIAVTPFTLMASELALTLMRGGTHPSTAIPQAYQAVGAYFGLSKIATATPIDPTVANSASGATTDAVTAGLLLAGAATLAQGSGWDPSSLVMALAADASDGTFDGLDATLPGTATFSQAPSQTVLVKVAASTTQTALPATAATSALSQATQAFQSSAANVSGGSVPSTLLAALAQSTGGLGATPTAYVSPYAFPFTIPLSQLTYDFGQAPRNSTAAQSATPTSSWYDATQFPTGSLTWGPSPALYPPPQSIPGSPTGAALVTWQQQRVLAVAQSLVGTPYQHHHIPAWDPSDIFGWPFSPASLGRNTAGLDCSDFSSFCYNYGLGIQLCTGVGNQATQMTIPVTPCDTCCPDARAYAQIDVTQVKVPPLTSPYSQVVAAFQPGDLLYYNSPATHVTMWVGTAADGTGLIVDDFGNNPQVNDSNGVAIPMGVHIRPWTPDTWYYNAFDHANRVITTSLPTYPGQ